MQHLLIGIASLAFSFALLGIELTIVGFALCLPAVFARPDRRIAALYWVGVCYLFLPWLSLHLTWITAWCALGNPPRPSLVDPRDIGAIQVLYTLTAILLFGSPLALLAAVCLTMIRLLQRMKEKEIAIHPSILVGALPLSWVSGYFLIRWDPLNVLYWYMD